MGVKRHEGILLSLFYIFILNWLILQFHLYSSTLSILTQLVKYIIFFTILKIKVFNSQFSGVIWSTIIYTKQNVQLLLHSTWVICNLDSFTLSRAWAISAPVCSKLLPPLRFSSTWTKHTHRMTQLKKHNTPTYQTAPTASSTCTNSSGKLRVWYRTPLQCWLSLHIPLQHVGQAAPSPRPRPESLAGL